MTSSDATPAANRPGGTLHHPAGFLTRKVINPFAVALSRRGISVRGSLMIEVAGRKSGEPRQTVVNLVELDGVRYVVAQRGVTQWVRNLRAAEGACALVLGRQRDEYAAEEITGTPQTVPVLRKTLAEWGFEVSQFFPKDIDKSSSDAELQAIAGDYPVFRLTPG
ncbi:nitroreductase/quinone reductase family protein [Myceligenerans crystallogenes]|uniref:Nitroreductase family deazaflavin-dependent oxidoreductase n=1 Tax=Myceligenerans crystallogenes TaxID=316335 RepID=A0ABP4ZLZ8_9MICO